MQKLEDVKGIGSKRLECLHAANIFSLRDLLFVMPISYKDTLEDSDLNTIQKGDKVCLSGAVSKIRLSRFHGISQVTATLITEQGNIPFQYFNQPWMKENLSGLEDVILYGRVDEYKGKLMLNSPSIESERGIIPTYKALLNIPNKMLLSLITIALESLSECVKETLPLSVREKHHLCEINFALRQIHFPLSKEALQIAKRRMAFENLFLYQAAMGFIKKSKGKGVQIMGADAKEYISSLPFELTEAQQNVLKTIEKDLKKEAPMSRLVQGDVGCGKTAVAFGAVFMAAQKGFQSAMMAPTEILARQHYISAKETFKSLHIECGLLVASMKAKEKREALEKIKDGTYGLVIGTHALLSEQVIYHALGLVITDEQHRFGVKQRKMLQNKAELTPNALVMSATPIPRSLALVLYGDLDISIIDQMPKGRSKVETRIVGEEKRDAMYSFIINEVKKGRQAYIVCPLVEESEVLEAKSAQDMYAYLAMGSLKDIRLGLVYGKQKQEDKESTMQKFVAGEIDVLVSTTVIEVGVNVPNATVMVIESAEMFGLSQLHQLRGRVGRGKDKSWCFFMAKKNQRLDVMVQTNDGFVIAEEDLKQRGPGDFLGTRQHGEASDFMSADVKLIEETKCAYQELIKENKKDDLEMVHTSAKEAFSKVMEQIAFD